MDNYLLNSAACLAILLLFYKIFLENEQMHKIKRGYLLISVLASVSIPLITFTIYVEPTSLISSQTLLQSATTSEKIITDNFNWQSILWTIYGIGVLILGIRFIYNMFSMIMKIRKNQKIKGDHFIAVLLDSNTTPHTFLKYLFFNKNTYEKHLVPQEVLLHEQTHAKELHSIDVLIIELLQVVFWFNPLFYLAKNAIKLNHEFLADQAVIQNGIETKTYQNTLLAFSSSAKASNLANAFNYSSIKKRFTVMKTHTSKQKKLGKTILIIPLIALLLYSFSTKEEVTKTSIPDLDYNHVEIMSTRSSLQDIATEKMVEEYNTIARKYKNLPEQKRKISNEELTRLTYIYDRMTNEQKMRSESYPKVILPKNPPPPPKPTKEYIEGINPPSPPAPPAPVVQKEVEIKKFELDETAKQVLPLKPHEHIRELEKEGAVFYINDVKVGADKVIEVERSGNIVTIDILKNTNGVSEVRIFTKEGID